MTIYSITVALPGCLPTGAPTYYETPAEAREALAEQLEIAGDESSDSENAHLFALASARVREWNDSELTGFGQSIFADGYIWAVTSIGDGTWTDCRREMCGLRGSVDPGGHCRACDG